MLKRCPLHFLIVDNMLGNTSVSNTRVLPSRVFGGSATLVNVPVFADKTFTNRTIMNDLVHPKRESNIGSEAAMSKNLRKCH